MALKLVSAAQMQEAERRAAELGHPPALLMERAGFAIAREVRLWAQGIEGRRVLLLVGPGNNGGDGLVAARHLADWGARVCVQLFSERGDDANLAAVAGRLAPISSVSGDPVLRNYQTWLRSADVVIDALLGTGAARPIAGPMKQALDLLRDRRQREEMPKVVAVDLTSGTDADSGALDPAAVEADLTLTLGCPKLCHFLFPAAALRGELRVLDIGLPPESLEGVTLEVNTSAEVARLLPPRPANAHKGTFGRVLVIGGSSRYPGAPLLAAKSALRSGAGLACVALPLGLAAAGGCAPLEVIHLPVTRGEGGSFAPEAAAEVADEASRYSALVLGCGLGLEEGSVEFVRQLLPALSTSRLIIDADGLNALATWPGWWEAGAGNWVLTPHVGEMARLTGLTTREVAQARLEVARQAAARWGQVVVLKGAFSVIAEPGGRARVDPCANSAMATAGSGDVLSGAVGAFLAQGLAPFEAACCGVRLHAVSGGLVRDKLGEAGVLAGDLADALPQAAHYLRSIGHWEEGGTLA